MVYGLARAANALIAGWRSCGSEGVFFSIPSFVVVNGGGGYQNNLGLGWYGSQDFE